MITSRNPATGEVLQNIPSTELNEVPEIFKKARHAQMLWASQPLRRRAQVLLQIRETLIDRAEDVVDQLVKENGKPRQEALMNEIIPIADMLGYFAKRGPKILRDHRIPLTLMKHRMSYLNYWPLGVVAVISPWNYPFMLPFGEILMALIAGNAVVFKPSEVTPLVGLKIQEICNEAGLPPGVLQTVIGDGALGVEIIKNRPAKIFFTGSVATGKKVMAAASEHLIPVNLELGGKDAMIVLPDADLDFATSAALWGGFSNAGQVCASTERILVHERIAEPFLREFKNKAETLRMAPSIEGKNDLGPVTFEKQKQVYDRHLSEAKSKNATFVTGGEFTSDRRFLKPTIVTGSEIETLAVYNEETFGPVVAVTTFKTIAEAVQKANESPYGLLASVITRNIRMGEEVAKQLAVGTVTINEVVYTAGLGETPWGGVKDSGIGRSHSDVGLYEFVNTRHIHRPRSQLSVFKSFWWFPYTDLQYKTFRLFLELYRRNWLDKLKALPHFLTTFIQFIKGDPRI
ncbi:MAG: aldehyde dehydrogenase family protein [Bdellovibrio sp.]|nr:aldehyde dehydrogenase family protein [Bdellovibrio sp.]